MKSIKFLAAATVGLVGLTFLFTSATFAQDKPVRKQDRQMVQEKIQEKVTDSRSPMGRGMNFIDENGNGICDRFEQGQGMRQGNRGQGKRGQGFIDENGDGICDHRGAGNMRHGKGRGAGRPGHGSMNRSRR